MKETLRRRRVALISLLTIMVSLIFSQFSPSATAAESNGSQVTYSFVAYNDLTVTQKDAINSGEPKEVAKSAQESYTLVYKPTVQAATTGANKNYPRTGEKQNVWLFVIGSVLFLGMVVLIFLRRKHLKMTILLFSLLSGISVSQVVYAVEILKDPVTKQIETGGSMAYTPDKITGYDYVGYLHESIDETQGQVLVHYKDEQGETIQPDTIVSGTIGESQMIDKPSIEGYSFKTIQGADANGAVTFAKKQQEVTLIYAKREKGTIIVRYVNDLTGKAIQPDATLSGYVGESQTIDKPAIDGYVFKTIQGTDEAGNVTFTKTSQEVTLKYVKQGKVILQLVNIPERVLGRDESEGGQWGYHHPDRIVLASTNVQLPLQMEVTGESGTPFVWPAPFDGLNQEDTLQLNYYFNDENGKEHFVQAIGFDISKTNATGIPTNFTDDTQEVKLSVQSAVISDHRLKQEIQLVGKAGGFNLYSFSYKNDPSHTRYVGVIAQEVMLTDPSTVVLANDGYYRVNYSMLGLRMVTLEEYQKNPAAVFLNGATSLRQPLLPFMN